MSEDEKKRIWAKCREFGIQQKYLEFMRLLELIERLPHRKLCLEIGAFSYGCTVAFQELFDEVIVIEPAHNANEMHLLPSVEVIHEFSQNAITTLTSKIIESHEKFDMIMIDGDHTELASSRDYLLYRNFLKDDGIIVFHDIIASDFHRQNNCFVSETWKWVKSKSPVTKEIISEVRTKRDIFPIDPYSSWGGIGVTWS